MTMTPPESDSPSQPTSRTASAEPVLPSRLLPRISFRWLFGLMTIGAIFSAVARSAGNGAALAEAAMVFIGFLVACFALFVILFLIAWSVALLAQRRDPDSPIGSPFADGQLPPQILPPRDARS